MCKKISLLLISLLLLISFIGCNTVVPLGETENNELVGDSFASDTYFDVEEGESLSNEELKAAISLIPSNKYEAYPNTHNIPLSATLYKNGESIMLEKDDPRLIKLINFFNNCVYNSECAYTQGLLPLDHLEKSVFASSFRLELKYTPSSDKAPSPYGTSTTGCDTIIITTDFTLIAHHMPGYEGEKEQYPYQAVGFSPLYNSYPWLDLFGF